MCLPDAPARPERGCGRSRGEGQSLCHSCRWLVSSPPSSPPPRAAPAAEVVPALSPGRPGRCSPLRPPPRLGAPARIPRGCPRHRHPPCLRSGSYTRAGPFPKPPSRGIPALRHQLVRMPLAARKGPRGARERCSGKQSWGSVCKPLKWWTPKAHHEPKLLYHRPQERS